MARLSIPKRTISLSTVVLLVLAVALTLTSCAPALSQSDGSVLRVAPNSDLTILDPIWTTATVSLNHGFLIYDTLFGMDVNGRIQPQMVDKYETSTDGKTWTFTLREGLEFHDANPVTSE